MRKKLMLVVFLLVLMAGCKNVTPEKMKIYSDHATKVVMTSEEFQVLARAVVETLTDPNMLPMLTPGTRGVMKDVADRAGVGMDRVQEAVLNIAQAIVEQQYSGEPGAVTVLETAQAVNAVTAPWNPYAGIIAAGLTLATALLTRKTIQQSGQIKTEQSGRQLAETALAEVVTGLEDAKKENPDITKAIKVPMNAAQGVTTREMVTGIRRML